jgi:hypothetical protein
MKISASIFLLLVINPFFSLAQNPLNPDSEIYAGGKQNQSNCESFYI